MVKYVDSIIRGQARGKGNGKKKLRPPATVKPSLPASKNSARRLRQKRRRPVWIFGAGLVSVLFLYQPVSLAVNLFGLSLPGRYMIAFQNNAEVRGSGGFLGSFAIVELDGTKVKNYYFESNIYKKDNEFSAQTKLRFPDYLDHHFKGIPLTLHDANYPADFSEAAQNMARFYELEYGDRLDGVIALNGSAVQNLIETTGPITLPSGATIDSQNFFDALSREVEQDYFANPTNQEINEPKTILKEMVDPLLNRVKNRSLLGWYRYFNRQVREKQILFWFRDDKRQKIVEKRNWGGRVSGYPGEYIFISNNNLFGGKTSLNVVSEIELSSPDKNSNDRTLTVTSFHNAGANYGSGSDNRNYMKIFLPSNAVVRTTTRNGDRLKEEDMDIINEAGRKAVGLLVVTPRGGFSTVELSYSVNDRLKPGKIYYQKQPGAIGDKVTIKIKGKTYFTGELKRDRML